jgi:hypothetical protein
MSVSCRPRIIGCMAAKAPNRATVLADIRTLAATPTPLLDEVERTLTDGYACALEIETERLRLQRRLQDSAAALTKRSSSAVEEVSGLAQCVARADGELSELRDALAGLASVAQRLRVL